MAKSECKCEHFSCESVNKKNGDSSEERFRYVKENGAITEEIILYGVLYTSGYIKGNIKSCDLNKNKDEVKDIGKIKKCKKKRNCR
jgi:hypothetical protein